QIATEQAFRADAAIALRQINELLEIEPADGESVDERRQHYTGLHNVRRAELAKREAAQPDLIMPEYLTAAVRRFCDSETIVLNEGITNYTAISDHIGMNRPGQRFTSGGSSLGWNGGAAIGMKLANPEKTVVSLTGDGSYMFSQPSTVHWIAR